MSQVFESTRTLSKNWDEEQLKNKNFQVDNSRKIIYPLSWQVTITPFASQSSLFRPWQVRHSKPKTAVARLKMAKSFIFNVFLLKLAIQELVINLRISEFYRGADLWYRGRIAFRSAQNAPRNYEIFSCLFERNEPELSEIFSFWHY